MFTVTRKLKKKKKRGFSSTFSAKKEGLDGYCTLAETLSHCWCLEPIRKTAWKKTVGLSCCLVTCSFPLQNGIFIHLNKERKANHYTPQNVV